MGKLQRFEWAALPAALAACLVLAGCGTPGAPQPPSLNLPNRVEDLSAVRAGNQVALTWTMPRKNTDKLFLKGNIAVRVCRSLGTGSRCDTVTDKLELAPGAAGTFSETLPAPLAAGAARPLSYFVELRNRNGRSAGLSNAAMVVAGEAPPPITGLTAEVRKAGVVLHWQIGTALPEPVRLHRKLLTPPVAKPKQDLQSPPPEPLEENLLVESDAKRGRALDKDIHFGQSYEYRAQRVARVSVNGQTLELAGELSAPVRVEALDVFPPAVPTGLAAVATAPEAGTKAAIDLNWQPDAESDLAGYAVYRREGDAAWQRISPAKPVVAPGFHDEQVETGHTYRYAVSAIGENGHESARSAGAEETVPNP